MRLLRGTSAEDLNSLLESLQLALVRLDRERRRDVRRSARADRDRYRVHDWASGLVNCLIAGPVYLFRRVAMIIALKVAARKGLTTDNLALLLDRR